MSDKRVDEVRSQLVDAAGNFSQSMGAGRVLGQIFAFVYFSMEPRTLDDLVEHLEISKGSASMSVRQLEQWGALRRVWVKGDRKAYYEANTELGRILRRIMTDFVGRTMEASDTILEEVETDLSRRTPDKKNGGELDFITQRVGSLRVFRDRLQGLWDNTVVKMLMKR